MNIYTFKDLVLLIGTNPLPNFVVAEYFLGKNKNIKKIWLVHSEENKNYFIDCPPGSSCAVMESIKDADYCILVTEPTIMGLHDFKMVHELVSLFDKPYSVVLNKCTSEYNPAMQYCQDENINILTEIPYDNELSLLNSQGKIVARENKKFNKMFSDLLETVLKEARK